MAKLIAALRSFFMPKLFLIKVKPNEINHAPDATIANAYKRTEELIKSLELVKYMLEDTKDWKRLSEEDRKLSQENLERFFRRTNFQATCLRDELMLTLQRIPNVRLYRKESNDYALPQKN